MSHVVTERGAALVARSSFAYVGEFLNALRDSRIRGGPTSGLPGPLNSFFGGGDDEEARIFRAWLVSHDLPYDPGDTTYHRFQKDFWEDWATPFWYFVETLKRQFLSQENNRRVRTKVSHRLSG